MRRIQADHHRSGIGWDVFRAASGGRVAQRTHGDFHQRAHRKFKTSWTQTALCMFGERFINDDQLVKWGEATRNAIMAMASHAGDMPFLIDNYTSRRQGGGRTDFQNLIQQHLEGGNKDRLNRDRRCARRNRFTPFRL